VAATSSFNGVVNHSEPYTTQRISQSAQQCLDVCGSYIGKEFDTVTETTNKTDVFEQLLIDSLCRIDATSINGVLQLVEIQWRIFCSEPSNPNNTQHNTSHHITAT
jgi:hypothetical protein